MLLDQLLQLPTPALVGIGAGGLASCVALSKLHEHYKIRRLGSRPFNLPSWIPLWGLSFFS